MIVPGTCDEQTVDPALDQPIDDLSLSTRVLVRAHRHQQVGLGQRRVLDHRVINERNGLATSATRARSWLTVALL